MMQAWDGVGHQSVAYHILVGPSTRCDWVVQTQTCLSGDDWTTGRLNDSARSSFSEPHEKLVNERCGGEEIRKCELNANSWPEDAWSNQGQVGSDQGQEGSRVQDRVKTGQVRQK